MCGIGKINCWLLALYCIMISKISHAQSNFARKLYGLPSIHEISWKMQSWAILTLAQKRFARLLNTKLKMPGRYQKLRILDFMQTGAGCQSSKYLLRNNKFPKYHTHLYTQFASQSSNLEQTQSKIGWFYNLISSTHKNHKYTSTKWLNIIFNNNSMI